MARIETMQISEAEYTCAVGTGAKAKGLAMRGSPYTVIRFIILARWFRIMKINGHPLFS